MSRPQQLFRALLATATLALAATDAGATVVVRYTATGALASVHNGGDGFLDAVSLRSNMSVVAGGFDAGGVSQVLVARFTNGGSLDGGFGFAGVTTFSCGSGSDESAVDVEHQTDGRIIVLVKTGAFGDGTTCIARLNTNGSLDTTFGLSGFAVPSFAEGIRPEGMEIDRATGDIVVLGTGLETGSLLEQTIELARLRADGRVGRGRATGLKYGTGVPSEASAFTIDPSGRIVVVGKATPGFPAPGDFGIARFTPSLAFDTTFNGTGRRIHDLGKNEYATGVHVVGTNILVFGAQTTAVTDAEFIVIRYSDNGTRNGSNTIRFPGVLKARAQVERWDTAWNGSMDIFLTGNVFANSKDAFLVARFSTSTLALVPAFGGSGFVTTAITPFGNEGGIAVSSFSTQPTVVGN